MAIPTDPGSSSALATYTPQQNWSFPNYAKILEMLMAPYRKMEEERLAMLAAQRDAQMELAKRANASTMEDLGVQRKQALRNLANALASSGLADSGAKHFQGGMIDRSFSRQRQSAANSLEAQLMALANSFASSQLASTQGLQQQQLALMPQVQAQNQPTYGYDWLNSLQLPKGYG